MAERHHFVIVGGGRVGVGLAVELGLRDIDCVVIERRRELPHLPKGQHLTSRTLEHFYFWGIEDELRDRGRLKGQHHEHHDVNNGDAPDEAGKGHGCVIESHQQVINFTTIISDDYI